MKTINKTKSIYINLSVLTAAMLFVFSLTSFNSEFDNEPSALINAVVFEIEVTNHLQSPPKVESITTIVTKNKINMEIPADEYGEGKGKILFRGDRGENGEVILVDQKKNECFVMDDAFIEKMVKTVDESKSMMNEAMKNLTKEQLDMMKKMQEQEGVKIPGFNMTVPVRKVVNTGIRATKAGYTCVKHEFFLDGVRRREIWNTDWSNIEGGDEVKNAFRSMNNFFDKLKEKTGDLPGGNDFFDNMNFEDGFPVVTKGYDEDTGDLEDESILRSVKRQTVGAYTFDPSTDCNIKKMFGRN